MKFTDIFIRRPVLATVVSLMILVLGLRAVDSLPVLQYPQTENAVVTVTTTLLRRRSGHRRRLRHHAAGERDRAGQRHRLPVLDQPDRRQHDHRQPAPELRSRQGAHRDHRQGQLGAQPVAGRRAAADPDGADRPVPRRDVYRLRQRRPAPNQITDYLVRVVQPRCRRCPACRRRRSSAAKNFALRAWLDPDKLAAYGLTATDVTQALAANNFISGPGQHQGPDGAVQPDRLDQPAFVDEFRNLVVEAGQRRRSSGWRMSPTSRSAPTTTNPRSTSTARRAVYIGIQVAPAANLLDVIKRRARRCSRDPGAVAARA